MNTDSAGIASATFNHTIMTPTVGSTFLYQYGYRELAPSGTDSGTKLKGFNFNTTNAYEVTWTP